MIIFIITITMKWFSSMYLSQALLTGCACRRHVKSVVRTLRARLVVVSIVPPGAALASAKWDDASSARNSSPNVSVSPSLSILAHWNQDSL